MTAKPKKPALPAVVDPERAKQLARNVLSPSIGAAVIAHSYSVHGDVDIAELYEQIAGHCQSAHDGNLKRAESMLTAQAHSLDAIFTNLARRASLNLGQPVPRHTGNAGDNQKPAGCLCQASQHRAWAPAG